MTSSLPTSNNGHGNEEAKAVAQSKALNDTKLKEGNITAEFSITYEDHTIIVQTIFLKDCCWIWLSDPKNLSFGSLDVVMPSKYSPMPLTSPLLGSETDSSEIISIAQRISKKFNMQVFLSGNFRTDNTELLMHVQNQLLEKLPELLR